jgi:hypothetical protein
MSTFFNRSLSLLVAIGYVLAVYLRTESSERTFRMCIGLVFPLACIWFGEQLGNYTGIMRGHYVSTPTPGWLVAAGGWSMLVGAPLVAYALKRSLYSG